MWEAERTFRLLTKFSARYTNAAPARAFGWALPHSHQNIGGPEDDSVHQIQVGSSSNEQAMHLNYRFYEKRVSLHKITSRQTLAREKIAFLVPGESESSWQ
eukprot:scaffold461_cov321-Pavlova_lutheri.AAC.10